MKYGAGSKIPTANFSRLGSKKSIFSIDASGWAWIFTRNLAETGVSGFDAGSPRLADRLARLDISANESERQFYTTVKFSELSDKGFDVFFRLVRKEILGVKVGTLSQLSNWLGMRK